MSKTLSGAYLNGYTLSGASQGVLNPVSVTGSIAIGSGLIPAALYAQGPNTWTITNQGSITGGAVDAVELAVGGTVVNYQAGFLSGHIGVAVLGSPGGVTNSGAIIALSAGTAASAYQAIGVLLSAGGGVTNQINSQITGQGAGIDILGGTGTVLNSGTIAGRAYDGVYLANGSVTNLASGVIKGGTIGSGGSIGAGGSVVTSGWGVVIRTAGTLSNQGSVTGIGQGGAFLGGGTVSNQGIIAGAWGIAMSGGTGTVINSGYLDGTVQSGVFLSGGAVTNTGTGRIVGVSGVVIRGAAGTVVNGASITATSPAGYAVYLAGGFADRVVDNPGGRFTGLVNGGNAIGAAAISTLELGSGGQTGTLSGLGTQFINFAQVTVDAGAAWSLNGPNNVATGVTLANQGSLAVNGALLVNGAMTSVGAMTVASTAGINASVTVDTAGATWNLAGELVAGNLGTANVTISNAATLAASASGSLPAMALGAGAGGSGSLLVTGAGSQASLAGQLNVGQAGAGGLLVQNAALLSTGNDVGPDPNQGFDVAQLAGGSGSATVTGTGSRVFNKGRFVVGDAGVGSLAILAGGTVNTSPGIGPGASAGAVIANAAGAGGSFVDVSGSGSNWQVTGLLDVGANGSGALLISGGATVIAGSLDSGDTAAAVGQISLSGTGTNLMVTGAATVADAGTSVLSVLAGAAFTANSLTAGAQSKSSGAISVSGTGTTLNITGALTIGGQSSGSLSIVNGATVTAGGLTIGGGVGGSGNVVIGPGSHLNLTGAIINVGLAGSGVLDVQGGTLSLVTGTTLSPGTFGRIVQVGGLIDPAAVFDASGGSFGGGGTAEASVAVLNTSLATVSGLAETLLAPLITSGDTVNLGGVWSIKTGGTLILDATTVDNSQTISFGDSTGELVIGQQVTLDATQTPQTIAASALSGFQAPIVGFKTGDTIAFTGLTVASDSVTGNVVTLFDAQNDTLGTLTFQTAKGGVDNAGAAAAKLQIVPCFAAGTLIETTTGLIAVEDLQVGDHVVTADGHDAIDVPSQAEPIVWIGSRTVNCEQHPKPESVWPIRVRADAFGTGRPMRDLYLSPDHAVFVNDVLVPVRLLVNGSSIVQVKHDRVRYFHVELPRHAVILAESLPVESYLDVGDRENFHTDGSTIRLFPDFAARLGVSAAVVWAARGVAPLVITGPELAAARRVAMGHGSIRLARGRIGSAARSYRRP